MGRTTLGIGRATVDLAQFPKANGKRADGVATRTRVDAEGLIKVGPLTFRALCRRTTNGEGEPPDTTTAGGGFDEDGEEAKILVDTDSGTMSFNGQNGPRSNIPAGTGTPSDDEEAGGEGKHKLVVAVRDPNDSTDPADDEGEWRDGFRGSGVRRPLRRHRTGSFTCMPGSTCSTSATTASSAVSSRWSTGLREPLAPVSTSAPGEGQAAVWVARSSRPTPSGLVVLLGGGDRDGGTKAANDARAEWSGAWSAASRGWDRVQPGQKAEQGATSPQYRRPIVQKASVRGRRPARSSTRPGCPATAGSSRTSSAMLARLYRDLGAGGG